ncbi:MAG TPA: ROK family protein [Myxococcales bacterium]|nr:ROK family protein [Myxococcales bacterium]
MKARDEVCVGVDLSGSNVRAAVVDPAGRVLGQERHRLLSKEPPQVAEAVVRAAKTACGAAGLPFGEVRALGIGVAGQVEKGNGMVAAAPSLGWKDVALHKLLQARASKLPMTLTSDLAAAAWAERVVGAGKGADDLIVVLVGSTVGAGIVASGKLHEGSSGAAGELGHVKVHPNGRVCSCGQRGCLDAYASAPSLANWARDDLRIAAAAARASGKQAGLGRRLLDHAGGDPERITAAAMERAAHEGDELSNRLLDEAAKMLGQAIANLVIALNPERLLLGGGLLSNSPRMRRTVGEAVEQNLSAAARAALHVGSPGLDEDAPVIGASLIAREALSR